MTIGNNDSIVNLCIRTFETRTDNSILILKHKMLNINFCEGLEFRASRDALKGTVRCQLSERLMLVSKDY